jgi:hypothetical protein
MDRVPVPNEIVIINNKTQKWYIPEGTLVPEYIITHTCGQSRSNELYVSLGSKTFDDFCEYIHYSKIIPEKSIYVITKLVEFLTGETSFMSKKEKLALDFLEFLKSKFGNSTDCKKCYHPTKGRICESECHYIHQNSTINFNDYYRKINHCPQCDVIPHYLFCEIDRDGHITQILTQLVSELKNHKIWVSNSNIENIDIENIDIEDVPDSIVDEHRKYIDLWYGDNFSLDKLGFHDMSVLKSEFNLE